MNIALRPATLLVLNAFRARRQRLLWFRAGLCLLAVALVALVLIALLDRARFMPEAARPWLTLAVYAGGAYAAWRVALRHMDAARDETGTARLVESAAPELRERLLAAVELSQGHQGDSVEFRARLQDDVAATVEKLDLERALPLRSLKPWMLGAGGAFALIVALSCAPGLHLPGFLARAAVPFANLSRPSSVKIAVVMPQPADTLVPFASELEVAADITGTVKKAVVIETQAAGAKARRADMRHTTGTRHEALVAIGQADVRYRILAADAISPWHTLTARARPRVNEFAKTIIPPAYAGLPETRLTEDTGDIEALDGSTVKLTLKPNQPISKGDLLLNPDLADHPEAAPVKIAADGTLGVEFVVKSELEAWQVALTAKETGFNNDESSPWQIIAIPDMPPVVQIIEPLEQLELIADESVRLSGMASDDVGLAQVKLAHAVNGAGWQEKEIAGKSGKELQVQTLLPLAPLQVKAGDTVVLKLVATDLKGQRSESPQVRVIILKQTVDPRQRQWAQETRRLAQQAGTLAEQTQELRKSVEQIKRTERGQKKNPEQKLDADDALARAQTELQEVTERSDDLWEALKDAARTAPTHLDAMETQLLGEKLAHMRHEALAQMQKQMTAEIANPENIRRAASEAHADAEAVAQATKAFAAEDNARVLAQSAQQLHRQENLLTDNALPANRDAAQRPQWQEQQRAAIAATENVKKEMQALEPLVDGGQQNWLKDQQKQIGEAAQELTASLDKPEQTKSPEHLYGAADNLRQRMGRSAEAARNIAENAMNRANQRREQLARQENPAVVALQEAKNALGQAAAEAKDGATAAEKAQKELAQAAMQLEDQAALREQNVMTNDEAALDTSRASRAADQLARQAEQMPRDAAAVAETQKKAEQLTDAIRALEADALAQTAMKASEAAAANADPTKAATPTQPAEQARAAAEALRQLPDALRRMKLPDQQLANTAQQAADQNRNAAEQLQNLARQAATQQPNQPLNTQPAQEAANTAQQKAAEVAQQLSAQTEAARASLAQLTPEISEMMKAVAQDLKKTQEQTQAAANDAAASKPVDQVAQKAEALQSEAAENAEKMESLQAALRQEANAANLQQADQRQMARTADVALAQMQKKSPQIAQNLRQAAQATQSQPQAQNLQQAAQAQQQTAQALDQLAQNMEKMENGQQPTEQELAAMQQMEQQLGVQEPLDEAYARAQALAQMAQDASQNPAAVLAELEKELPKNGAMQKALAEISKQTAQASEQAVAAETQQPSNIGLAADKAANDLARVSRHQQRLGQQEAAQQTAQASNQLQQQALAAKGQPGQPQKPTGQPAQAAAAQAAKAAEATASATPPAMMGSPLQQLQGALLAQALDQLDATLHPMQGQQAQQQGQGQQQPQQGGQQSSQQQAQQSLASAQQSQQQQMADQRNQGQTPGSSPQPGQPQMAQGQQPGQPSETPGQNEGGDLQAMLKDGVLGAEMVLVKGDWGHLPSKMAEDLSEATRSEAAPEYRAAIESYYKAIATKAKR